MNIKIQDSKGKLTFLLQIEDKVTIIEGLSATGKSTLVRYIDLADTANITIDSPIEIIHLNSKILGAGYKLSDNYLYILDEDDGIENEILTEIINRRKYNIILITRETVNSNLNYSIQQIYEFKTSGKINKLVRKYDNISSIYKNETNQNKLIWG